jgi:hypothetical protein
MNSNPDMRFGAADIDAAVARGALERAAADRLTAFLMNRDADSSGDPDEERLRLITGFNDIFVTIGIGLFIGALSYMLNSGFGGAGSVGVALAAWALAEVFTRRRRMALPSIVLLIVFVTACLGIGTLLVAWFSGGSIYPGFALSFWEAGNYVGVAAGLAAIAGAALHWWRFHVPITVAAFAAGLALMVASLIEGFQPGFIALHPTLVIAPIGIAIFAAAMAFDARDRHRLTQRTDIAFWLHLLAAPLIVHPVVYPILKETDLATTGAAAIISIFTVLCLVALTVDRRALLVSSLLYLGYASSKLLSWSGLAIGNAAVAVLIVGATVLALSVAWQPMRRLVLQLLPSAVRGLVPPPARAT